MGSWSERKIKNIFPYAKRYEFYGASELSFVTALVDEESERSAKFSRETLSQCASSSM